MFPSVGERKRAREEGEGVDKNLKASILEAQCVTGTPSVSLSAWAPGADAFILAPWQSLKAVRTCNHDSSAMAGRACHKPVF